MAHVIPPLDCSLNMSEIIDLHIAGNNRHAAYAFPDGHGGITEISHFEFCRAAHRVAHILRPGRRGAEGQVLGIVALTDVLMYQTIMAGCIRAGIVPFAISNRNTAPAVFHLLSNTGSHRLLTTKGSLGRLVGAVSEDAAAKSPSYELSIEEVPLLGQIYPHLGHESAEHAFQPYPAPATRVAVDDVVSYLHSSGSTGFPKSIPQTHRTFIDFAALEGVAETVELSPRHAVGALPPFHALASVTQFVLPLCNNGTACIHPLASTATEYVLPVVPTPENAIENAQKVKATGITTVPAMILEWQSPEIVEYLKTLSILSYSGGPLASRVGDSLVAQGVNLISMYAGTEFGCPTLIKRDKSEVDAVGWAWVRFSNRSDVRWVPQDDGLFECQFLTTPTHHLAVENLDDAKGYATKDLFERHPTKHDLYKIVGRLDDVLIMANGEKTVPGPMEDIMNASPNIAGAIMFGRERNEIGVLLEPHPRHKVDPKDEKQLAQFRNLVWPVIEQANENAPSFARVYKEMILVTHPDKPMRRAPKGTVMNKATIALYKEEIDTLYDTVEASGNAGGDIEPPVSWTAEELGLWLATHASLVAGKEMHGGEDLFDQGFDSLNATFLRRRIISILKNSTDEKIKAAAQKLPQNFVYAHPSVEDLAHAIMKIVLGDINGADDSKAGIEQMIVKYTQGFDHPIVQANTASGGAVVLLTGSTGGLGSQILELLLGNGSVERVYALNRKGRVPVSERQRDAFVDRALDLKLLSSQKLVYLEGDTTRPDLALPADVLTTVRTDITVVIHNAWKLDFNLSLASFESHVKGTRNLIDLARNSPNASRIRFLFTSSIASAQGWDNKLGPFPEEMQLDPAVAVGSGYGESKYVSERILAASGLHGTSFRIGQVSGAQRNGSWSTTDWIPAIVKSSLALGNFPSDPSVVAWITPEAVTRTIVDVALRKEDTPFAINLVHPRPVPWNVLMSGMADTAKLSLVPFADWIHQLEQRAAHATAEDIERIPGIKLVDFFKAAMSGVGNTELSTLKAQAISDSVKLLKPLNDTDAKRWMHYWKAKGLITY
ncbi:putative aminoadipate reductase [Mycena crocata]|nr:putative aminoadipate reductase [Mycena crocata]